MSEADWQHFKVRLSPEMHERLKVAAALNRRSMSQEIMARLETSFGDDARANEWFDAKRALASAPVPVERTAPDNSRLEETIGQLLQRMAEFEKRIERRLAQQDSDITMMVHDMQAARERLETMRKSQAATPSRTKKIKE